MILYLPNNRRVQMSQFSEHLLIATHLIPEVRGWDKFLRALPPLSKEQWIISSIQSSIIGGKRIGTSHMIGAIDLAPIASLEQPMKANGTSPLLFNNRIFCDALRTTLVPLLPFAIFVENDHIHVDVRNLPGVYLYRDFSKYSGDAGISLPDPLGSVVKLTSSSGIEPSTVNACAHPFYTSNPFYAGIIV